MKLFGHLSFISATALAGFLAIHAAPANAAAAIQAPAVQLSAPSEVAEAGYYYYHGRRYPYRYHGMYYGHRYYRGGRYHYY
jgi:hypothetical protein